DCADGLLAGLCRDGQAHHHHRRVLRLHLAWTRPGLGYGQRAAGDVRLRHFRGSLIGGCAYFANDAVNTIVGVNIPWLVFAIGAIVIIAALCHFHITLTAAILGVTLISEVCVLFALAFSVIFKGGGPDGLMLNQTVLLNNAFESLPAGAFGTAAAA